MVRLYRAIGYKRIWAKDILAPNFSVKESWQSRTSAKASNWHLEHNTEGCGHFIIINDEVCKHFNRINAEMSERMKYNRK